MRNLPQAEVISCYFDDGFMPNLAAMRLRWPDEDLARDATLWHLPDGVRLLSPAPEYFGIRVDRTGANAYSVQLLWNKICLRWSDVTRERLLGSSIATVLSAINTDLRHLLAQPLEAAAAPEHQAA